MLIGLDFMTKHKTTVDLKNGLFHLQGQTIPFIGHEGNSVNAVSAIGIRTPQRVSIPARSVFQLKCASDDIRHRPGMKHINADALSRQPDYSN